MASRFPLTRLNLCLPLACSALLLTSPWALAQTDIKANSPYSAYLQDSRGHIARSGFGLCWRTNYWTPADAVAGCDAPLVATPPIQTTPVAEPPAPPKPAPAPAPAPVKRCDMSLTLANDQTFDFNASVLKASAKNRIDNEFLSKLNTCSKIESVLVTGHTDLIGSHPYNQKLSEKRADAVASYLTSHGLQAPLETMGMGKTQQIKACDEKLAAKQLHACLAPNRRVVIELRGIAK